VGFLLFRRGLAGGGLDQGGDAVGRVGGLIQHLHGRRPRSDGGGDLLGYYLGQDVAGRLIVGTRRFTYNDPSAGGPRAGLAAYQEAIRRHYFGVIMLSLGPAAQANRLERTVVLAGYRRVAALPFAAPGPGPGPVQGSSTGRSASPGSAAGAGRDTGQSWNIWVRAGRP